MVRMALGDRLGNDVEVACCEDGAPVVEDFENGVGEKIDEPGGFEVPYYAADVWKADDEVIVGVVVVGFHFGLLLMLFESSVFLHRCYHVLDNVRRISHSIR